ncbi:hypothetical protein CASFOL_000672 [Castilleja foliolosa]|uniref:Trichome birefringence-like N-terminal domain-containing protein n=1 Tax=Castilleja foliolosa TaxID=1961234 RepID=A0ABD3EL29_9LAMI
METYNGKLKSQKMSQNMIKLPHIAGFVLVALVVVLHQTRNNGNVVHLLDQQLIIQQWPIGSTLNENDSTNTGSCDLFSGQWVYDDTSYPLYKEEKCSFMEEGFACQKYGRKDLKYQNWRWKPHHCDLPSYCTKIAIYPKFNKNFSIITIGTPITRFNGTALLEKIRGKKLIFVGDSLNRNQWRSMLCLLDSYLPASSNKKLRTTGNLCFFHATEYNVTIGFYWSPMLVESSGDNVITHSKSSRVVRVKSIEDHGRHWADADILVFDSFAWWMSREALTIRWGSFGSPNATQKTVERNSRPFEIALSTWSDWLEMNINRTKTKLFFMSPSPYRPGDTSWGTDHNCDKETEPVLNVTYWASAANREMMRITKSTIDKLEERGLKVEYLNITELSAYREDAHPTTNRQFWRTLSRDELESKRFTDCLHWCLPGVPDVWNQILFAYIMKS